MVEIRPEDFEIQTYSSGINQPVAVRVIHRPTGWTATAEDFSRLRAREKAVAELREALRVRERGEQ